MDEVLAYSTSKANYHTQKIADLQKGLSIAPLTVQVDLEAYCNDNCRFCAYREELGYNTDMLKLIGAEKADRNTFKPLGMMTAESGIPEPIALDIPRQMAEAGIPAVEITGGGEPTLARSFDKFVSNLIEHKREIGLVTNCSQLNDARIDMITGYEKFIWLRTSFDASNSETHRKVHRTPNSDFDRRVNMLQKLIEHNKHGIEIGISFIINPDNYDDIEPSAKLYRSLGANHIRFSWQYDKSGSAELPQDVIERVKRDVIRVREDYSSEKFRVYAEVSRIDTYNKPNTDFSHCFMKEFVWAIGANALVYPCCIMKYLPGWEFGDLRKLTLKQMIDNADSIIKRDVNVLNCHPCWLRERNKSIAGAVIKPKHENFI